MEWLIAEFYRKGEAICSPLIWATLMHSMHLLLVEAVADIFSLKQESSIFRSVIQPCFLHDGTG